MLQSISNWIDFVGMALGVTGSAAFVFAYLRTNVTKQTIAQLQELSTALNLRVENLEKEREAMEEKIQKLAAENTMLREMITGERTDREIVANMKENHTEVIELLEEIAERLNKD